MEDLGEYNMDIKNIIPNISDELLKECDKIFSRNDIYDYRRFENDYFILTATCDIYHINETIKPIILNEFPYFMAIYTGMFNNILQNCLTPDDVFELSLINKQETIENYYIEILKTFMLKYTKNMQNHSEKLFAIDTEITDLETEISLLENHLKYVPNGDGYHAAKNNFESFL